MTSLPLQKDQKPEDSKDKIDVPPHVYDSFGNFLEWITQLSPDSTKKFAQQFGDSEQEIGRNQTLKQTLESRSKSAKGKSTNQSERFSLLHTISYPEVARLDRMDDRIKAGNEAVKAIEEFSYDKWSRQRVPNSPVNSEHDSDAGVLVEKPTAVDNEEDGGPSGWLRADSEKSLSPQHNFFQISRTSGHNFIDSVPSLHPHLIENNIDPLSRATEDLRLLEGDHKDNLEADLYAKGIHPLARGVHDLRLLDNQYQENISNSQDSSTPQPSSSIPKDLRHQSSTSGPPSRKDSFDADEYEGDVHPLARGVHDLRLLDKQFKESASNSHNSSTPLASSFNSKGLQHPSSTSQTPSHKDSTQASPLPTTKLFKSDTSNAESSVLQLDGHDHAIQDNKAARPSFYVDASAQTDAESLSSSIVDTEPAFQWLLKFMNLPKEALYDASTVEYLAFWEDKVSIKGYTSPFIEQLNASLPRFGAKWGISGAEVRRRMDLAGPNKYAPASAFATRLAGRHQGSHEGQVRGLSSLFGDDVDLGFVTAAGPRQGRRRRARQAREPLEQNLQLPTFLAAWKEGQVKEKADREEMEQAELEVEAKERTLAEKKKEKKERQKGKKKMERKEEGGK